MTDDELVSRIESLTLSPREFGHREHVQLAFALLRDADFGDGALRFRAALKRFAASIGAHGKYHETLTWAWLSLVAERMAHTRYASSEEFLAAHPDLLDKSALNARYDLAALLASPLARAVFVLPTRP